MKPILPRTILTLVALALVAADPPRASKQVPPDDHADVKTVQGLCHGSIALDSDGNVTAIGVSGSELRSSVPYALALARLRNVRSLGTYDDADQVLAVIKPWARLENVDLRDVSDRGLAGLECMHTLKSLRIYSAQVTDVGAKSIGKLKNLEVLTIQGARITDACMKDVAALSKLRHLDLKNSAITDRGLAKIKGMELEALELRTTKITDRGIYEIKDMSTLKELDVFDTKVTKAALAVLKGIPGVKVLGLPRKEVHEVPDDPKDVAAIQAASIRISAPKDNVTDNVYIVNAWGDKQTPRIWMKHLKGLHNLKELVLPDNVSADEDLALLTGLATLEKFRVRGRGFSDVGMRYIGALAGLRELDLGNCARVTAAGIDYVGKLKNLQVLHLRMAPVTDDELRSLAKLTKLRELDLGRTKVTDAGLAHLAPLVNLQELGLEETQTTDSGLVHLRALKKLRKFWGGAGVTRDGLIGLAKDIPGLVVPQTPWPYSPR